jgi:HK97 family phage portal protein
MALLDIFRKKETESSGVFSSIKAGPTPPGGDVIERPNMDLAIFKALIPQFLYKPPFGYPRAENLPLLKQFARNGYVFSVISALQEEAAWSEWDIKAKGGVEMTPELEEKKKLIENFLRNPNDNKEGWSHLVKTAVRDICEIDSGVWVKVFSKAGEMVQLTAKDGATFLKNPDIYGSIGNREDIIFPDNEIISLEMMNKTAQKRYAFRYRDSAAYFQYGWQVATMPIPFGRREVIFMIKNPRADSMYGISPVAILADVILTLVYGSMYNLDFYQNNNMPEGILQVIGASNDEVQRVKARLNEQQRTTDPNTGFTRKVGFNTPVVNRESKFTPFQLPTKDLQIIEQQNWFTRLVWACFGVSADDLGFTEDSNKAVSETQKKRFARKAVKPILHLIQERVNMEIIPEFDTDELCFKFDNYDLDEDIKQHTLYQMQIQMGIKTPEMVAEEEKIDIAELKKQKEENMLKQQERMQSFSDDGDFEDKKKEEKDKGEENQDKSELKAKYGLKVGMKVKATTMESNQVGIIEQIYADGSMVVKFDNKKLIFHKSELVPVGNEPQGALARIKAEQDPFANTKLEKDMEHQIKQSAEKIKKAVEIYGKGALSEIN